MERFLPSIETSLAFESPESTKLAYIALLHLAEHAHADVAIGCKASGSGGIEGTYAAIDEVMVKMLDARLAVDAGAVEIPKNGVADPGTGRAAFKPGENDDSEDYYEFEKAIGKWPNKQERGRCDRARKAGWMLEQRGGGKGGRRRWKAMGGG